METLDFALVVVPLSIVITTLSVMVYYLAHKEEINRRKNTKLVQSFIEKRVKQQAAIRNELEHIEILYNNGSINESIYKRLQNVILMTQERQRFEAIATLTPKEEGPNTVPETTLESPIIGKQDLWLQSEIPSEEQAEPEVKEETEKKPKRKQAKKAKTRKKKEPEIGLIPNPRTSENVDEEKLYSRKT